MTNGKTRRTEIQIETHEITTIRFSRGARRAFFCERCRREVQAFAPESVAAFSRLVESGEIHLIETARGALVCADSLDENKK